MTFWVFYANIQGALVLVVAGVASVRFAMH